MNRKEKTALRKRICDKIKKCRESLRTSSLNVDCGGRSTLDNDYAIFGCVDYGKRCHTRPKIRYYLHKLGSVYAGGERGKAMGGCTNQQTACKEIYNIIVSEKEGV